LNLTIVYSGKPGGLGSLTGAQSVSFRQGSNVEFGAEAHERMVSPSFASILDVVLDKSSINAIN